jgi:hypothetical protein
MAVKAWPGVTLDGRDSCELDGLLWTGAKRLGEARITRARLGAAVGMTWGTS